ncbi:hypothetical protein Lfu02_17620 [Longispora fulva]|uniref:HK97 family phage portal protein n=1 Tax=Longispora fulva TaxID=619741 RepID=A0A8J7H0M5_9ACTN|nr:phage portal protein [Longispora fulva]MBG6140233.1 HK97 family phage portal protein [Longispora fulva]GIG57390.1 hypothetical protein Lfu02_17620 [Longispora fulva]
MSILRRALSKRALSPSGSGDPWAIPSNGSLNTLSNAGVTVTEETALSLLVVMACVRIISEAVAGLPLDAVRMRGKIREQLDPAPRIISDPFGGANDLRYPSRRTGLAQLMVSLLLRGNAFAAVIERDAVGRPSMLRVLHPDRVRVTVTGGQKEFTVDRVPVDPFDMLHMVGMSTPGADVGLSVISYARQAIGLGLAAEEYGSRFFGSGAHLSGIVQVPGDLDNERARQLKERFTASHTGLRNAHTVGVLTGGASWTPISVSPEDAQFLATREAQNLDIAMLYGIPPHMLGRVDRTTSWGAGIEQQALGFSRFTLESWTGRIEDAWSALLPKPQVARFNLAGLLRTDTPSRFGVYTAARTAGVLTTNEIRALENYPPIAGGDDITMPLNSATTGKDESAVAPGPDGPSASSDQNGNNGPPEEGPTP